MKLQNKTLNDLQMLLQDHTAAKLNVFHTNESVEAMTVEEVRENLEKVMIADRDSSNYEEAYLFEVEGDPLAMGVAYIYDESVVGANIVAGYEFDIR